MDKAQLKLELKTLVISECDKDIAVDALPDDALLIGSDGPLDLDSLDALQIALAIKQRYGVRVDGGQQGRKVLESINSLAEFILTSEHPTNAEDGTKPVQPDLPDARR